jgi:putative peptidoglycan binding protein
MSVPFLSPGQTDAGVPRLKQLLVPELLKLGLTAFAQKINVESTTYGPTAVAGVREFQKAKKLEVDGCVGKNTWAALGVKEPVVGGPKAAKPEQVAGGQVIIAPGANLPGQSIEAMTLEFVAAMAASIGKPITVTTGTNHSKMSASGKVSDHFSGHACDIGMFANGGTDDSPVGDAIMQAACLLAGDTKEGASAKAKGGGLFTFNHNNQRIQCIWKTNEGGNHHNHVHVGVRPA